MAQNERQTLNNAFLSLESGRRSIGSSNAASGLSDGALTFSDGSNSGYANANLANIGGLQMAVAYDSWGTSLALYQYQNGSWTNIGPVLTDADCINDAVLFELAGSPAVAYLGGDGRLKLKRNTGTEWADLTVPIPDISAFDLQQSADGQTAHLCYVSNSADAYYVSLSAQGSASPILYAGGLLGNPKVVVTDTAIYAAVFDSNQNELVSVYPLSAGDSAFGPAIPSPGNAGAYDLIAYDNTLYFAAGASSQLLVKRYNGTAWEDCAALTTDSFTPQLAVAQGNLYLLTAPSRASSDGLRVYSVSDGKLQQEGEPVDIRNCSNYSLIASQDNLFVGYTANSQAMVRRKTTANPLVSLTITPPSQTTYLKGQPISTSGLRVVANYANSSRELSPTEYSITNFETTTAGEKLAMISFGGKQNTFAYTVLEEVTPRPTRLDRVTLSGPDAPAAGAVPDTGVAVAETGAELSSVSWSGALESGKFGYNQTYTVKITLSAKPGYAFGDAVAATLNGETVQATKISDDTLQITRSYPALLPPEISVTPAVLTLEIGQSATLSVTDPTGAALRWTSGDSSVAAVDQSGRVTGVAAGNTEITVTNAYGKLAAVPVTVKSATDGETNPRRPEDGSGSGSAPQQNPEAPGMNQNAGQAQKPGQIVSTGDGNEILEYVTIFLFCMAALAVLVVLRRKRA